MSEASRTSSQRRERLRHRIPSNSWDSHMHVFDTSKYSLLKSAPYDPVDCSVPDALAFEASFGLEGIVLVQPSGYGNDNSCMLEALRELGPARARGVVTFDPATIDEDSLREWHTLGVRGVRVNLHSVGWEPSAVELQQILESYAAVIGSRDWVLQVYVPLQTVEVLERIMPALGVRLCIDHIGQPDLGSGVKDPYDMPGFSSLVRMLKEGKTYVKMSGAYRFGETHPSYEDVAPIAKEVLRVAGKTRVVFATDWPHVRYEDLDITPWFEKVLDWCGEDEELIERVFRGNAKDLWGLT